MTGTTKNFLEVIKEKFPETWDFCDYSNTEFRGAIRSVNFVCKEHGEFEKIADSCGKTSGLYLCPRCNFKAAAEKATGTKETFLEKIKDTAGPLDSFENFKYVLSNVKGEVSCKEHGPYLVSPGNYIQGGRCPLCSRATPGIGLTLPWAVGTNSCMNWNSLSSGFDFLEREHKGHLPP